LVSMSEGASSAASLLTFVLLLRLLTFWGKMIVSREMILAQVNYR